MGPKEGAWESRLWRGPAPESQMAPPQLRLHLSPLQGLWEPLHGDPSSHIHSWVWNCPCLIHTAQQANQILPCFTRPCQRPWLAVKSSSVGQSLVRPGSDWSEDWYQESPWHKQAANSRDFLQLLLGNGRSPQGQYPLLLCRTSRWLLWPRLLSGGQLSADCSNPTGE